MLTGTIGDEPQGVPGSGLVAVGGFAFAPDGGDTPSWEGFAPASMIVPEVSFARQAGHVLADRQRRRGPR